MKLTHILTAFALTLPATLAAQEALTIYNQDFAVVRDRIPLDLRAGETVVTYAGVTAQLEPDSVILSDPAGKVALQILDQSYRGDTLSQGYLLSLNEGKTLDFIVRDQEAREFVIKGKVIRSGYNPDGDGYSPYDGRPRRADNSPIIEVNGQLRFSLPGEPVFPALGNDTILKPTLTWRIATAAATKLDAELSYLTDGLSWQAAYNLVAPEKGDSLVLTGWVTFENYSGKEFTNAIVKLLAGDVHKIREIRNRYYDIAGAAPAAMTIPAPPVTEKAFDEFHLYTLANPVSLHDHETKQVEFARASNVTTQVLYIYDGAVEDYYRGFDVDAARNDRDYGTQSNKKVWVMREFKNSKENGLGIALPKGRVRFYRRDDADNSIQFVGENNLDHTPEGELVRIYTGDAFDIVGARKRTNLEVNERDRQASESFEITLRNHKKEPVEVRVVEHLYRWTNWDITQKSMDFTKTDAQTIEFRVPLQPDEEKTISYTVLYNWR